jgi:hypothetical protein
MNHKYINMLINSAYTLPTNKPFLKLLSFANSYMKLLNILVKDQ